MLSSELEDSSGRMYVWHARVCNCVVGSSAIVDVLAICPKATAIVLSNGPVMGSLLLGLLKWHVAPESRRSVLISWEGC